MFGCDTHVESVTMKDEDAIHITKTNEDTSLMSTFDMLVRRLANIEDELKNLRMCADTENERKRLEDNIGPPKACVGRTYGLPVFHTIKKLYDGAPCYTDMLHVKFDALPMGTAQHDIIQWLLDPTPEHLRDRRPELANFTIHDTSLVDDIMAALGRDRAMELHTKVRTKLLECMADNHANGGAWFTMEAFDCCNAMVVGDDIDAPLTVRDDPIWHIFKDSHMSIVLNLLSVVIEYRCPDLDIWMADVSEFCVSCFPDEIDAGDVFTPVVKRLQVLFDAMKVPFEPDEPALTTGHRSEWRLIGHLRRDMAIAMCERDVKRMTEIWRSQLYDVVRAIHAGKPDRLALDDAWVRALTNA